MIHYNQETSPLAELIVNTCDTTRPEPEYLRTPADLARYLRSWSIPIAQAPDEQDLADVLALRSRLRSVFEAGDLAVAAAVLNELLEGARAKPRIILTPEGTVSLELDVEDGLPLARRLAIEAALSLGAALERYGIERLHVCNASPCTDVFIDTSRNHTRRYCCEQCANRHNVAAYRQRKKTA